MTPGDIRQDHQSAGCRLRAAREQWSLSLREVADALNLLVSHVRAIEADRCGALAKDDQFVRHLHDYANLLLLDANDVEQTFRAQSAPLSEPIQERLPENKGQQHRIWACVGAIAALCACAGFGWFYQTLPINTDDTADIRSDAVRNTPTIAPLLARNEPTTVQTSVRSTDTNMPIAADDKGTPSDHAAPALAQASLPEHGVSGANSRTDTGNTDRGKNALLAVGAAPRVAIKRHVAAGQAVAPADSRTKRTGVAQPLHSNAWFADLEPDRYTLQLLSFTREASSHAFIRRHHLQEDAAYFAARNDDGETWYAVTYGLYDSYEAAIAASQSLPESISELKPRVRNTGRIQQIMRREQRAAQFGFDGR